MSEKETCKAGKGSLFIKLMLVILAILTLAGCGQNGNTENDDDISKTLEGVWADDAGNLIHFLPDESAYVLKKANGRIGSGTINNEYLDIFTKEPLPNKDTVDKMIVSDLDVLHSLNNEYDGRGLYLFTDGASFVILSEDGTLSFETNDKDLDGEIFRQE